MNTKKHLQGGTLRKVMVAEIFRAMKYYAGQSNVVENAAIELGITARTLRMWRGPVAKGGWVELQPDTTTFYDLINEQIKKKKRNEKRL